MGADRNSHRPFAVDDHWSLNVCISHSAPHPDFPGVPGQLVLLILDGVGFYDGRADGYDGNALDLANTPNLDRMIAEAPIFLRLKAHGTAVGLPSDADMGNSEVGHNAMGAGRIFEQGAKLVNEAIASRRLFEGTAWRGLVDNVLRHDSTFHLWVCCPTAMSTAISIISRPFSDSSSPMG